MIPAVPHRLLPAAIASSVHFRYNTSGCPATAGKPFRGCVVPVGGAWAAAVEVEMNDRTYYAAFARTRSEALLLQRVCYLLCTSLIVTALMAYAGRNINPGLTLPLFIATLVCLFAVQAARNVPALNLALFYGFSALEGLFFAPALAMIVRYVPNGSQMISLAFCLSAVAVGGVGTYVWTTAKDFGHWGRSLWIGLWVLIGVGILAWFVPGMQGAPIQLLYSAAIVVLFTGFLFYDFSNIRHRYSVDDYIPAAINLYLDFVNLFWAILRILLILSGGGRSRD
jgi:FtsH-binding integral membrane protein